jgi:hypothetical protein
MGRGGSGLSLVGLLYYGKAFLIMSVYVLVFGAYMFVHNVRQRRQIQLTAEKNGINA